MLAIERPHQLLVGNGAVAGALRTVIGHGGILAHQNLPVETRPAARVAYRLIPPYGRLS